MDPRLERLKVRFRAFMRPTKPRGFWVRDLVIVGLGLLLLLGSLSLYTGQAMFGGTPLVAVESGSMMHGPRTPCPTDHCPDGVDAPGFGRVGTIDPGDLVLVKKVRSLEEVETAFDAGDREGYGGHGDVIVYNPSRVGTPLIHRAVLTLLVENGTCQPGVDCIYRIPETCDARFADFVPEGTDNATWQKYCQGSGDPITMRLSRGDLWLEFSAYPCSSTCGEIRSGLITKGDNNPTMDQTVPLGRNPPGLVCCPVALEDIRGKARGEIPWLGAVKFMLAGNDAYCRFRCGDPTPTPQWTILQATAPRDIWICLFLSVAVIVAVPWGIERWAKVRRARKDAEP